MKAMSGHYRDSGIQRHSVGETYPLIVSRRGSSNTGGQYYVWNGLTGETLQSFAFPPDPGSASVACRSAFQAAQDYAARGQYSLN